MFECFAYFFQYEGQDVRELKMIFEGQNSIHDTVRHIHRKLDEVIGRQEQTLSQVSSIVRGGQANSQVSGHVNSHISSK